jgi:hypothetical protein
MENYCSNIIVRINLLILIVLPFTGCKDIIEEDISEDLVNVIIPQDSSSTTANDVHFKWDELDGADAYRLQIVEPSFTNISSFVLDSLITGTDFYYTLSPGNYEFQIRGENSYYQSIYNGPFSFSVDSSLDLSVQTVPLLSPNDMIYSNQSDQTFTWQIMYAADNYEIQIRSGTDFNSGTTLLSETSLTGSSYSTTGNFFSTDGVYHWGVRAFNQSSQSGFNSRTISIDQTLPNDVVLTSPTDASSSTSDTVVFKWTSGLDPGTINSPISYILEIDTDISFGSPSVHLSSVDTLQLILGSNTYYWRVYAQDEAGNQSAFYSSEYSIIVP